MLFSVGRGQDSIFKSQNALDLLDKKLSVPSSHSGFPRGERKSFVWQGRRRGNRSILTDLELAFHFDPSPLTISVSEMGPMLLTCMFTRTFNAGPCE